MHISFIALSGFSGCGKTSLARKLSDELKVINPDSEVVIYSLDNLYKPDPHPNTNFDNPESVDLTLANHQLQALSQGKTIEQPTYCFKKQNRLMDTTKIIPGEHMYIIIEGIFAHHPAVLDCLNVMKVYVNTSKDICLTRRILRDVQSSESRGFEVGDAFKYYHEHARPMAQVHIRPLKKQAHLIVNGELPTDETAKQIIDHLNSPLYRFTDTVQHLVGQQQFNFKSSSVYRFFSEKIFSETTLSSVELSV